jgi:hypothetical protein
MLKEESLKKLQSEKLVSMPNLNSLMKISLGLIFFTLLSTALVYAEVFSTDNVSIDDDLTFTIFENAYLENNTVNFDKTMVSVNPGDFIVIVNNDVVSHSFVSGISNSNNEGKINYADFIICELGEKISPETNKFTDDNLCDFNKDNRIITTEISPGSSMTFSIDDIGTYRLVDPAYPWLELLMYSFPKSETIDDDSKTIEITPPVIYTESISIETGFVDVDDTSFQFPYTVTGMTISEIESDTESMSLIFYVDVDDSSGKLDVTFDRSFFDSIYDGVDDEFFVLADGDETSSTELQTTSNNRSLSIDVPYGTEELEIIGSEFNILKEILSIPVIETPVIETPVIETPVIETPVIETPVIETVSTNECGPGTILENNVCVLDERCGPGTILENNVCVLDSATTPTSTSSTSPSSNKEIIVSFSIAFAIAGVIGIILALIAKAHKKKN